MSLLKLQYDISRGPYHGALSVEILGSRSQPSRAPVVLTRERPELEVNLDPGDYFLRASRASGATFEVETTVGPGPNPPVVLPPQRYTSPHEWLGLTNSLGILRHGDEPSPRRSTPRPQREVWIRVFDSEACGKVASAA